MSRVTLAYNNVVIPLSRLTPRVMPRALLRAAPGGHVAAPAPPGTAHPPPAARGGRHHLWHLWHVTWGGRHGDESGSRQAGGAKALIIHHKSGRRNAGAATNSTGAGTQGG